MTEARDDGKTVAVATFPCAFTCSSKFRILKFSFFPGPHPKGGNPHHLFEKDRANLALS
jgi:hypothetical protein